MRVCVCAYVRAIFAVSCVAFRCILLKPVRPSHTSARFAYLQLELFLCLCCCSCCCWSVRFGFAAAFFSVFCLPQKMLSEVFAVFCLSAILLTSSIVCQVATLCVCVCVLLLLLFCACLRSEVQPQCNFVHSSVYAR